MRYFLFVLLLLGCASRQIQDEIPYLEINELGINARHFSLPDNIDRPMLILLSGSGGSYMRNDVLYGLVKNGYDVLSLAYFGQSNQPKEIELVPIEYINDAVKWIASSYNNRKIILMGISKGAEMGLLYASKFNDLDGLICYAPSSIVIPNHVTAAIGTSLKSSWTYQKEPVACAPLDYFSDPAGPVNYRKYIDPMISNNDILQETRIKVENIECPVLLLAGKDDQVWPSFEMAQMMYDTLKSVHAEVTFNAYENCGHQFFWFGDGEPVRVNMRQTLRLSGIKKHSFLFGGSIEGTKKAMVLSKETVLEFLKKM